MVEVVGGEDLGLCWVIQHILIRMVEVVGGEDLELFVLDVQLTWVSVNLGFLDIELSNYYVTFNTVGDRSI
jgi:hypothetical protein